MKLAINSLFAGRPRIAASLAALSLALILPYAAARAETNIIGGADGGFEAGFTGMVTSGDATTVPNFGLLLPTQGGTAAVLTTEPNEGSTVADADAASLRIQGFSVPADAATLRLDYSFLTKEPRPSLTNDRFVVKLVLVGPATEEILLAVDTFDSFVFAPWTGYAAQTGRRTLVADVSALAGDGNTYDLELRVEDVGDGRGDSAVFLDNLRFADSGDPLAIAGFDFLEADVGEVILFDGSGSTDDAGVTSYDWVFGNGFIGNGSLIALSYAEPGIYFGSLQVTDGDGQTSTDTFVVVVGGQINSAPVIASIPVETAYKDGLYTYDVNVDDAEVAFGDVITFSLDDAPAGMTINPATGVISWTPTSAQPKFHDVTVRATDSEGLFDTQSFSITIEPLPFVIATDENGFLHYARSDGDGTWSDYRQLPGDYGGNTRGAAIADFDEDGDMDIVVGSPNGHPITFFMLENQGNDHFASRVVGSATNANSYQMDMTAGDFNNDGHMDFISDSNWVYVHYAFGDGKGGFTITTVDVGSGNGRGMDAADFDHDGNLDYVRALSGSGFQLFSGNGSGGFTNRGFMSNSTSLHSDTYGLTAGDFNNDGHPDVIANSSSSGSLYFFAGLGNNTFQAGVLLGANSDYNNYGALDSYDFNQDGNLDLFITTYTSRTMFYNPGNGDGTFGPGVQINTSLTGTHVLGGGTLPTPAPFGDPEPRITPEFVVVSAGASVALSASDSRDDGSIVSYAWSFEGGGSASGINVSHTFPTAEGKYKARLTVTDNEGKVARGYATIVVQDAAPVAVSGGPYNFGEAFASLGEFTVPLDGSGSSDDQGPLTFLWDAGNGLSETFDAPVDPKYWQVTANGAVGGGVGTLFGNRTYSNQFITARPQARTPRASFTTTFSVNNNGGPDNYTIWGLRDNGAGLDYSNFMYSFYFYNGQVRIYEKGSHVYTSFSYAQNTSYDLRLDLKDTGAVYYYRQTGSPDWLIAYDSNSHADASFRAGFMAWSGKITFDNVVVPADTSTSPTPSFRYAEAGTYDATLTVTDKSGQTDVEVATVTLEASDPPVADAGGPYVLTEAAAACNTWTVNFNGTGSSDDVNIQTYAWNFGDGSFGSGPTPSHTYAGPGTYTVTLTVTDNGLQTDTATTSVQTTVQAPPVANIGGPYSADETDAFQGLFTVAFNAGASTDDNGICDYAWNFGDGGTGSGVAPSHQYADPGTYTVTLTVRDHGHQAHVVQTNVVIVDADPPVPVIAGLFAVDEGAANQGQWTVNFDAASSTDDFGIWKYEWNFGDGTTGTGPNPVHLYNDAGVYSVTVTVFDHAGQSTVAGTTADVQVNDPPVPDIDAPDVAGEAYASGGVWTVPFDATGSTDDFGIWKYEWNFGDGQTGTGATTTHAYNAVGTYTVTLTVTDHAKQAVQTTHQLDVVNNNPPVADAGGPYVFGEAFASAGVWKGVFDATGSTDDAGIFDYLWSFPPQIDDFAGTVLDTSKWFAAGATQNDAVSVVGAGSWGNRYLFTTQLYEPTVGSEFIITVLPQNTSGNQHVMVGWKNSNTDFSYTQMPLALYFNNNTFNIYTFGSNLGNFGTYTRNVSYDVRSVIEPNNGISLYYRPTGTTSWIFLATRSNVISTDLRAGLTVHSGTIVVDDAGVQEFATGPVITRTYTEETTFDVTLRVRDNALQQDSETTSVSVEKGAPPVSDPGGPYTTEQGMLVALNSTGSQDDVNIEQYIWDFGDGSMSRVSNPQKFFDSVGTHTISLKVIDNVLQEDTATTTVEVVVGNAPVADAGGPYQGAVNGPAVFFDGSGSSDDYGIANYFWDVDANVDSNGDGNFTNDRNLVGRKVNHVYTTAGTYTATLTVVDGPGQESTDTASVSVVADLPPRVVTVPWVGSDVSIPHETYNGKQITLKGVAYDGNLKEYEWDFGDGTTSGKIAVTNANWFRLEATHTYPTVPDNTPFIARLTVWDQANNSASDTYNIIVKPRSLTTEVNVAIDEGLWNIHKTQLKTGADRGRWTGYSSFYASATASSINAFEASAHRPDGDPSEDPYVETVRWGLDYLFTRLVTESITPQLRGDPDANGNGIGVRVNEGDYTYTGGMVMDAIIGSGTPLRAVTTSLSNQPQIKTMRYWDVVQEMVESYAFGQSDADGCGGWVYSWFNNSNGCSIDNSASQWAAIGIIPAERVFNNMIPQWIKTQYAGGLNNTQAASGQIGYTSTNGVWGSATTTASGMVGFAMNGVTRGDDRWRRAEEHVRSRFDIASGDDAMLRNYYAMFATSKAMRLALPTRQEILCEDCANPLDWYADETRGLAYTLINQQAANGSWTQPGGLSGTGYWQPGLASPWAVLILTRELFEVAPVADAGRDRVWGVSRPGDPRPLVFDGSDSFHPDPFRSIVKYEWDVDGDGSFDSTSSTPDFSHEYLEADYPESVLPQNIVVTLRVTDDAGKTDTDTAVVLLAVPPHPPVADAGPPGTAPGTDYTCTLGLPCTLDGSDSFDIDPTDFVAIYGWELDGAGVPDFDEAFGAVIQHTFLEQGAVTIGLRVKDDGRFNDLDGDDEVDENERLIDQEFVTVNVVPNQPPVANPGGPYLIAEGGTVNFDGTASFDPNGDAITYEWDLDNDGTFETSGPTPTKVYLDNGVYTVALRVSDSLLSDVSSVDVTVTDLGPLANFNASPQPGTEGTPVSFADLSASAPDAIASWAWEFGTLGNSTSQSPSFTFPENGTYDVTLTVTDDDGSAHAVTKQVVINNADPVVEAGPSVNIAEGGAVNLAPSTFTDAGLQDTHTATINWGDGSPVQAGSLTQGAGSGSVAGSHVYPENGVYVVTVTVTDDDGGVGSDTFTVTVDNVAPVVTAGVAATVTEGSSVALPPSTFTDAGILDTHVASIDWGDGSPAVAGVVTQGAGSGSVGGSHVYPENGVFTVTVSVTDDDGDTGMASFVVTVENADPVVSAGPDTSVGDSGLLTLAPATFTDLGVLDTHTATIDWGDGSAVEAGSVTQGAGSGTVGGSHSYSGNGIFTVTVTVTDDDGGVGSDSFLVTVSSSALVLVDAGDDVVIVEGTNVPLAPSTYEDPGVGVSGTITATINWGDGSPVQPGVVTPVAGGGTVDGSHVFTDDGVYTVIVTILEDGSPIGGDSFQVTVNNGDPVVEAGPNQTIPEAGSISLAPATFTDVGVGDTHTATIDWGDGSPVEAGSVTQGAGGGSVAGSHTYADDGIYTVTVTVTDDDGGVGSDTFTVNVDDVAPLLVARDNIVITEGDSVDVSPWSFADPGTGDTHTATIDWGDGVVSPAPVTESDGSGFISGTHVYADDGVFTITATLSTNGGPGVDVDSFQVTVLNGDPVVAAGPDVTITEGESVSLPPATFTDVGVDDTHVATVNWGEGAGAEAASVAQGAGSGSVSASHTFNTAGVYTVTVTVTDDDGGVGTDTFTVTVESGVQPEQTIFNLVGRAKVGAVDITWTHVPGAVYNIYRSTTSGGPYTRIAQGHVSTFSVYADSNVTNGTTYFYVVRSVINGVESLNSNQASATPTARARR